MISLIFMIIHIVIFLVSLPIQAIGFIGHVIFTFIYTGWCRGEQFRDWLYMKRF